jgi:hypothetical protein
MRTSAFALQLQTLAELFHLAIGNQHAVVATWRSLVEYQKAVRQDRAGDALVESFGSTFSLSTSFELSWSFLTLVSYGLMLFLLSTALLSFAFRFRCVAQAVALF